MLCLVESRRYELTGSDVNMSLTTEFRRLAPEGVTTRRVIDDADVDRLQLLIERHWPQWWAETERAIEHGCCHAAFVDDAAGVDDEVAVGFCCHSVNRAAWLGPMGTDPDRQTGGVGSALLADVCRDLMIAEFDATEISWVGPLRFYGKNGATISRVFRSYKKVRPKR
jgi:GNAT superfamily N-acetyltransferase